MPKEVCQIDKITQEYVGPAIAYENPQAHLDGIPFNIPASCFDMKAPEKREGFAAVKEGAAWKYVEDHRGKIMFSTTNKTPETVTELGPIPDGFTLLIPGPYSKWKKSAWVVDEALKTAGEIEKNNAPLRCALEELDAKSIRALREWVMSQPGVAPELTEHEKAAQALRDKWQK